MKKIGYFYNEQGDYTITLNDEPFGFIKNIEDAKSVCRLNVFDDELTDEHMIGDYVDLILNFMPDGETPDNFLTAGKVIKKHYDNEGSDPCSYDLEFTVEIENRVRKTTRIYNVDAKLCWKRDNENPMSSAGVQLGRSVKTDRRTHVLEDDRTLNDLLFESFSEHLMFVYDGKVYSITGTIAGSQAEDSVDWEWHVFDQSAQSILRYNIDMYDDRLTMTSEHVIDYLSECFKEFQRKVIELKK